MPARRNSRTDRLTGTGEGETTYMRPVRPAYSPDEFDRLLDTVEASVGER